MILIVQAWNDKAQTRNINEHVLRSLIHISKSKSNSGCSGELESGGKSCVLRLLRSSSAGVKLYTSPELVDSLLKGQITLYPIVDGLTGVDDRAVVSSSEVQPNSLQGRICQLL